MSNVVDLPGKAPDLGYWRCNCGCMTFYLRSDGEPECAQCEGLVVSSDGGWRTPEAAHPTMSPPDEAADTILDLGDPNLALKYVLQRASAQDLAFVALAAKDGKLRTWGNAEGEEQKAWVRRRLNDAEASICGHERPPPDAG